MSKFKKITTCILTSAILVSNLQCIVSDAIEQKNTSSTNLKPLSSCEDEKKRIEEEKVSLSQSTYIATGEEHKPKVIINGLIENVDYTVTYKNNINVGNGVVIIRGINDYTGIRIKSFDIILGKIGNVITKPSGYGCNTITWSPVYGATYYEVRRSLESNGEFRTNKSTYTNSLEEKNLSPGLTYYYKVRAVTFLDGRKVYGEASEIVPFTVALSQPKISVSPSSYNSNKISWEKVQLASGYEIYMSKNKGGAYSKIKTITSGNTLNYKNTNLTTGKTYYYKVKAYRTVNGKKVYGKYSSIVSGTPSLSKPSVSLSSSTTKKVNVKWKKVLGASGYEIYRATSKGGSYSKVKTITKGSTTSYANSNLSSKKTYYYKVKAYRIVNNKKVYSSYSSVKYVKVK